MEQKDAVYEELVALRKTVAHHARLYYVEDAPQIPDYEYDRNWRRRIPNISILRHRHNALAECRWRNLTRSRTRSG